MPASVQHPSSAPDCDPLSQLIRLKRAERPGPEFWQVFEQSFRGKQLASLVQTAPWHERWAKRAICLVKRYGISFAAAGAAVVIATALFPYFIRQTATETPVSGANIISADNAENSPLFVVENGPKQTVTDKRIQASQESSPSTTYQVSVLSRPGNRSPYQLISAPRTLSATSRVGATQEIEADFGAKVIKADRNF